MKYTAFIVFIFIILHQVIAGQQVVISGNAPSYKGTDLVFMRYTDWITHTEESLGSCRVNEQGDFYLELFVQQTTMVFTYIGSYRAYVYIEPGGNYEIILPEYIARSAEERLNPYFQYVDVHLGIRNFTETDLNMLILMFDDAYIPYYNKHVTDVFTKPEISLLEKDIDQIEVNFAEYTNQFFRNYRIYMYGSLKMLANQQRVQSLSDEYFNNMRILYHHPVYGELFNKVYDKYFIFYSRTGEGNQVYDDINRQGSYEALAGTISRSNNFSNDTLCELIILKELHDQYYSDQFSRSALLNILDTLIVQSSVREHRIIGKHIKDKITRLQAGYIPPYFELYDSDNRPVKLSDYEGNYIYLNFCTLQSYTCLKEFNMLASFHKRLKDRIAIITIVTDQNGEEFRQFRTKNEYDWIFLHYDSNPEVLKEFDIRAFPTYFLIGPDGRLILSPAPSPAENFEARLIEIMRSRGDL